MSENTSTKVSTNTETTMYTNITTSVVSENTTTATATTIATANTTATATTIATATNTTTNHRRPRDLHVDPAAATPSSVDRLLADIASQRKRERQRTIGGRGRSRRRRRVDNNQTLAAELEDDGDNEGDGDDDNDNVNENEMAASDYWWTDMFLRYFVFDEDDCAKTATAADSDDLLFFVRRRRRNRNRHKNEQRRQSSRRRRIVYDTRVYRKQQQRQGTLLPIGDPAVLWRHTVCLNTIIHRLQYTLTVAVCMKVPRASNIAGVYYEFTDNNHVEDIDNRPDTEYDLQLLSRHVHTVYASTSGRRMDATKGPRERSVYPAVCWAADDYAEAFRTVIVRPGQMVCVELVASWPSRTVVEEYKDEYDDDDECDTDDYCTDFDGFHSRWRSTPKVLQRRKKAVLFTGAIPYPAVRAAYECKMSLYRQAENQRRKQRQHKRGGGKKSSLGAALSASLTALFTSSKDPATAGYTSDSGDYEYYYRTLSSNDTKRVEYVTVRGCRQGCDDVDDDDAQLLSTDDENFNYSTPVEQTDTVSMNSNAYNNTKGLAQMAVTLAPPQTMETSISGADCERQYNDDGETDFYNNVGQDYHYSGDDFEYNDGGDVHNCTPVEYNRNNTEDFTMTPVCGYQCQQQQHIVPIPSATASDPGDYYDYGWDYETVAGRHRQTPPNRYPEQQRLEWYLLRGRGKRRRRLSDPCITSLFAYFFGNELNPYFEKKFVYGTNNYQDYTFDRKQYKCQNHRQQRNDHSVGGISATVTPVRVETEQHPHRAWSESDGLDRCGGIDGWPYGGGGLQQQQQEKPLLLPPPPVPYYYAIEAATSGFVQYLRKSPGGWWTRMRNRRRRERKKSKRKHQNNAEINRRRSVSAGGNNNSCYNSTDDDNSGGSGSNSDENDLNSDEQESDGEFIGALAAAAAIGINPDREWMLQGAAGDPLADWDRYNSDSDSMTANTDNATIPEENMVEWTTEIMATDLRRRKHFRNESAAAAFLTPKTMMQYDNEVNYCCKTSPQLTTPITSNQNQSLSFNSNQQNRRQRPPPLQLRPQPLEQPPSPPALSVAFTAIACPWWTVLEDILIVSTNTTTSEGMSSSNKTAAGYPLLTFD